MSYGRKWLAQTAWFVSDATGLNGNSGAGSGSPIPEAERARRWGRSPVLPAQTTVTYLDAPTTDVNLGDVTIAKDAGLKILEGMVTEETARRRSDHAALEAARVGDGATSGTRSPTPVPSCRTMGPMSRSAVHTFTSSIRPNRRKPVRRP